MQEHTRVAVITGASRGLGAVIARLLVERGYDLVIGGRSAELLSTAAALGTSGRTVITVVGDIATPAVRGHFISAARELGGLDLLVNNASELGGIGPLTTVDLTRLTRVMHVNVEAPVALIQSAIPLLAARRGLIVNISSDAALGGYAGWGPYGASKAALDLLTRTLATELRDRGVSAISVDPGDMRTRMHQEAFPGEDISDRPLPEVTLPFWSWLLNQEPADISGQRFAAQKEDVRWLQPA